MELEILLSTGNATKTEQIRAIFRGTPFKIRTLSEARIKGASGEDGTSLEENALQKARFAHEHGHPDWWAVADDTGLFINALNGEPGVRSARWAGETATTEETMNYCLARLKGKIDRSASFKTVVAAISPEGKEHFFTGEVPGYIIEQPLGRNQTGMPYSSIFMPKGADQTWAQMSVAVENAISHRGIAFRKLREFFESTIK